MTITAKDMNLIAAKLRGALTQLRPEPPVARVAGAMCLVAVGEALRESNPRFDWERFTKAAVPDGWNVVSSYSKTPADINRRIREAEQQLEELRAELEEAYKNETI